MSRWSHGYKGAEWAPVVKGVCSKHRIRVRSVCVACHWEQLVAAGGLFAETARERLRDMGFEP